MNFTPRQDKNGKIIEWSHNNFYGERIMEMTYMEYVNTLKEKYIKVNGDYFLSDNFKTKNKKIRKLKYGIFIHHILANTFTRLSNYKYAKYHPFYAQKKEHLLYCNLLEHMILHFKIGIETKRISSFLGFQRLYKEVLQIIENGYSHGDLRSLEVKTRVYEMENIFGVFMNKLPLYTQRFLN